MDLALDEIIKRKKSSKVTSNRQNSRSLRTKSSPYDSERVSRSSSGVSRSSSGQNETIKLLLPNSLSGSLIGTGGSTIRKFIELTSCHILLSDHGVNYPGTEDRIVTLSGTEKQLFDGVRFIWDMLAFARKATEDGFKSLEWDPSAKGSHSANPNSAIQCRFVVPDHIIGSIIGKNGSKLNDLKTTTGANIYINGKDDESAITKERIITVNGDVHQCKKVSYMLFRLENDEKGDININLSSHSSMSHSNSSSFDTINTAVTMAIPDKLIANVIGKGGSTLKEISKLSGANITVSQRGEDVEGVGSSMRVITITGNSDQTATAQAIITQKVK